MAGALAGVLRENGSVELQAIGAGALNQAVKYDSIVIDAHCDTLMKLLKEDDMLGEPSKSGHIDLFKLKAGGVNVQFFAIYIEPCFGEARGIERAMEMIGVFYKQC